ncbi:MAG TPA: D-alanine--D-alanine ligase [Caulobacteraceae bacterium]|nr:D-alanine--D-alanine ligase [Caulobacteraceae bacterium]
MGGVSPEREVSLVTGRACADALERLDARVTRIDAGRDLATVLVRVRPDAVFNALHGAWGEDGCVQGVLETLAIPYTHSGVLASALAMDKTRAKAVMAAAGVTVPGGGLFPRVEVAAAHVMAPPYVVKPNAEGSSVGVVIVPEGANTPPREIAAPSWAFGDEVLVEPYIAGLELAVAVLGGEPLAVTEIIPRAGFYDYEAKYGEGGSAHVLPARIPPAAAARALSQARLAHEALGCEGLTRADLRYDDVKDILVLLEINTQPGMTPTSLAPEQAAHRGMGFDELVLWITERAHVRGGSGAAGIEVSKSQA